MKEKRALHTRYVVYIMKKLIINIYYGHVFCLTIIYNHLFKFHHDLPIVGETIRTIINAREIF